MIGTKADTIICFFRGSDGTETLHDEDKFMSSWEDPWKEIREERAKFKGNVVEIRKAKEERETDSRVRVPRLPVPDPDAEPDPDITLNAKLMARVQKLSAFYGFSGNIAGGMTDKEACMRGWPTESSSGSTL